MIDKWTHNRFAMLKYQGHMVASGCVALVDELDIATTVLSFIR